MFILNVSGTSDFKAAQWFTVPNGDLTMNLTGVTFDGYDGYKPKITLPRIYNPLQAGQTIAFHSDNNNRFIKMQCSGCDMRGSSEEAVDQLPSASEWPAERFTVVDAGNGQVAFHSKNSNCFMRMNDKSVMDGSMQIAADQLPNNWEWERFTLVDAAMERLLFTVKHGIDLSV